MIMNLIDIHSRAVLYFVGIDLDLDTQCQLLVSVIFFSTPSNPDGNISQG